MKRKIKFCVLASGSDGNACYFETGTAKILIDAGLSCREITRRLEIAGVAPDELDALVLTHEHTDHIKGAGPLSRRFDLPVFLNRKTLDKGLKRLGNLARPVIVQTGQTITVNDLTLETFTKCHDAVDPIGLIISCNGTRIGMVTDLGRSTSLVEDRLKECQALIMEFNYDPEMLEDGPYPLYLKKRIRGQDGHLSNQQAGNLLRVVSHKNLELVVLAHLSKTNNHPEKARLEAIEALNSCGVGGTKILISRQDEPMSMFSV